MKETNRSSHWFNCEGLAVRPGDSIVVAFLLALRVHFSEFNTWSQKNKLEKLINGRSGCPPTLTPLKGLMVVATNLLRNTKSRFFFWESVARPLSYDHEHGSSSVVPPKMPLTRTGFRNWPGQRQHRVPRHRKHPAIPACRFARNQPDTIGSASHKRPSTSLFSVYTAFSIYSHGLIQSRLSNQKDCIDRLRRSI